MALCTLCPRRCGRDREKERGFCGGGSEIRVARAALHFWEEPPISGTRGSGTVFFSGCPLKCVFCQNHEISHGNYGKDISVYRLSEIFRELEAQGAHNINLVTPMHYAHGILRAFELSRIKIPVAVNSGGYELPETVRLFSGAADIFMPDLKCFSPEISSRYFGAPDYFERACAAIVEMHSLAPKPEYSEDGLLKRGLIVRHLVLPSHRLDSIKVLTALSELLPLDSFLLSLMSQFTPTAKCAGYPEINRRVTSFEYSSVAERARALGFSGFMQERSSAKAEFTPDFDLTGV